MWIACLLCLVSLQLGTARADSTQPASAGLVFYTGGADPIDSTTLNYLNTTIAGLYSSTFTDANANIFIEYSSTTGLGGSTSGGYNVVSYSTYLNALTQNSSPSAIQVSALNALNTFDSSVYGSYGVDVTSALASALGITTNYAGQAILGSDANGNPCRPVNAALGCYNGLIEIATPAELTSEQPGQSIYYRQNGGGPTNQQYDFYSIVEHETDEILGTSSCISTDQILVDTCPSMNPFAPTSTPSAVDLYRYSAPGILITTSALGTPTTAPPGTAGAYFSYDGGSTNGAAGAIYNNLANKDDYADFASACKFVQDAVGCLGQSLDITTDGGAEINILNAVGYDVVVAPEPGTVGTLGLGFLALAGYAYRRRTVISPAAATIDSRRRRLKS